MFIDKMILGTSFGKSMLSKAITYTIRKKVGIDLDLAISSLEIDSTDEGYSANVGLNVKIGKEVISELVESLK